MKNKGEVVLSLLIIVISGILLYATKDFPPSIVKTSLSPAFYPRLILSTLLILSILLLVNSMRRPKESLPQARYLLLIICTSIGLLYLVLLPLLGYLIATPLFLFVEIYILEYRRFYVSVPVAIGFTLFSYSVFQLLLGVNLP